MMAKPILILSIIIIVLLLLLIALFVYLSTLRIKEKQFTAKVKEYVKENRKEWHLYLIEGSDIPDSFIPRSKVERQAVEEILLGYTKSISDQAILSRITAYAERFLEQHYRKQLQSRKWSLRMNTLYRIADFRMNSMMDDVLQMLKGQHKYSEEEYLQMYKILSYFKNDQVVSYLLNPQIPLGEYEYKKLLFDVDQNNFDSFIKEFDRLPELLKCIVIDIVGIKNYVQYHPFIESKLNDDSAEIRIRVLKAVVQMGVISDFKRYSSFIDSEIWEERLMLAKLLFYVPVSQSIPYLQKLLEDSSWWVRSQAAQTLKHSKTGKDALEAVISSSDDRYAVDMALEALAKE